MIKKKIFHAIYNIFAKHMPLSNSKYNFGQKKIREFFARNIIEYAGKDINIEKGASIGYALSIGDRSSVGVNSEINGTVTIGSDVMMGPEVVIYTKNHEFISRDLTMIEQGFRETQPVVIGDDVWIGRRVIILPGVHIGTGAVIGAGAVVAKDIPEYAIAVGNPVRVIGYRE